MKWVAILILLAVVGMTTGQTKDARKGRGNTDREIDGLEIERREAMGFGVVLIKGEKMEPVRSSKLYALWETDKEKVERRRAELVVKVFPTGVLDRLRKIEGQEGNPLATIFVNAEAERNGRIKSYSITIGEALFNALSDDEVREFYVAVGREWKKLAKDEYNFPCRRDWFHEWNDCDGLYASLFLLGLYQRDTTEEKPYGLILEDDGRGDEEPEVLEREVEGLELKQKHGRIFVRSKETNAAAKTHLPSLPVKNWKKLERWMTEIVGRAFPADVLVRLQKLAEQEERPLSVYAYAEAERDGGSLEDYTLALSREIFDVLSDDELRELYVTIGRERIRPKLYKFDLSDYYENDKSLKSIQRGVIALPLLQLNLKMKLSVVAP